VLRNLQRGDLVYRMSDHRAEQQALQADSRKTAIRLMLAPNRLKPPLFPDHLPAAQPPSHIPLTQPSSLYSRTGPNNS
jgi:hypothetical protein